MKFNTKVRKPNSSAKSTPNKPRQIPLVVPTSRLARLFTPMYLRMSPSMRRSTRAILLARWWGKARSSLRARPYLPTRNSRVKMKMSTKSLRKLATERRVVSRIELTGSFCSSSSGSRPIRVFGSVLQAQHQVADQLHDPPLVLGQGLGEIQGALIDHPAEHQEGGQVQHRRHD